MLPLDFFAQRYAAARAGEGAFPTRQVRDLTVLELGGGFSMVVAVDSDGGIGPREHDLVPVDDYLLGRFALRVPLLEIICCGAVPLAAFDMLTVSMAGGGREIVRGLRDELADAGLGDDFPLSGSTEENVPTTMTGIGTTVLGLVRESDFRPGAAVAGDVVVCAGVPKSAPEDKVRLGDGEIVRLAEVANLLEVRGVRDLLPVGSRGVAHEAHEMAASAKLRFTAADAAELDLAKSGGPSTCVLVSAAPEAVAELATRVSAPVTSIGTLEAP